MPECIQSEGCCHSRGLWLNMMNPGECCNGIGWHLWWAYSQNAQETLGGMPTIIFGDFAQFPPIGDTPLYSTKPSKYCGDLTEEGQCVFESFTWSATLQTVYHQADQDPVQLAFWEALLQLRTYSITEADYNLISHWFLDNVTAQEWLELPFIIWITIWEHWTHLLCNAMQNITALRPAKQLMMMQKG